MIVSRLELADYRNYREAAIDLGGGTTVLLGPNGQGKTNLVEAIGVLATGSSHRVSSDEALVRSGADHAIVRGRFEHAGRSVLMETQINRSGANTVLVNRNPVRSKDAKRYVDTVLFAPEDLQLIRGDPSARRRMLDALLILRNPRLAGVLADYDRVLRQRTTLLKSAKASRIAPSALSTLDVWDERLVELGSDIASARDVLVTELEPELRSAYLAIAGADHGPGIRMRSTIWGADPDAETDAESIGDRAVIGDAFRTRLAAVRSAELDRGVTLVGPHRDDLAISLRGLPAKGYASHGESWTLALSIRLSAAQLLRANAMAGDPIIVLDDVFAELDEGRRLRLAAAVEGFEQVLVTAAVPGDVPAGAIAATIRIEAGRVVDG